MHFLYPASFKLTNKSHLKFDLDGYVPEHLPQPTDNIYGDLAKPRNTLLTGPDFEDPISKYTISQTKDGKCGCGLLTGKYRQMLGADT